MRLRAIAHDRAVLALPAAAHGADLYVIRTTRRAPTRWGPRSRATPRRRGARRRRRQALARPGDIVHLASTTYHSQLRPLSSGTEAQPIVYVADGPVTILAPAGTVSVMLTGVHDIVAARLHGARRGAAGDLGRRREPDPDRPRDGRQRPRRRHADQGRHGGDGRALAADQQRARGPVRHDARARHDAERLDRQRATATTASATTATASSSTAPARPSPATASRATATASASSTASTPAARRGATRSRATRSAATPAPTSRPRAAPALVAGNRLRSSLFGVVALRQPGARDRAVQPHPGPLPARHPADHGAARPARARLWNNTVQQTGPLDRAAATPRPSSSPAPAQLELRNNLFAYTNRRRARRGADDQRPRARSAASSRARTGTRAPTARAGGWPGTARASRSASGATSRARTRRASTRRRRASPPAAASPRATWAPRAARASGSRATSPARRSIRRRAPDIGAFQRP